MKIALIVAQVVQGAILSAKAAEHKSEQGHEDPQGVGGKGQENDANGVWSRAERNRVTPSRPLSTIQSMSLTEMMII